MWAFRGNRLMNDILIVLLTLAAWLILNLWILPRFGVAT